MQHVTYANIPVQVAKFEHLLQSVSPMSVGSTGATPPPAQSYLAPIQQVGATALTHGKGPLAWASHTCHCALLWAVWRHCSRKVHAISTLAWPVHNALYQGSQACSLPCTSRLPVQWENFVQTGHYKDSFVCRSQKRLLAMKAFNAAELSECLQRYKVAQNSLRS